MKAYLEIEETEKLEEAATCLRDKLLIRLLARLGCRISEALALDVKDIDFAQGMVTIEHLKSRIKLSCPQCGARLGKSQVFCPKCGQKVKGVIAKEQEHRRMRTLPIDGDTLEMLKDYIERGGPVTRNGKRLIFGINRHRAWQIVKECAERAGLPDLVNPETGKVHGVSPHSFVTYFSMFKRLGWVEMVGEEPSGPQDYSPDFQPRRIYRLTSKGRAATMLELSDLITTLYHYPREISSAKRHRYYSRRS